MNETPMLPTPAPQKQNHSVAITAIIATAVVLLACIAGCTWVMVMFTNNMR